MSRASEFAPYRDMGYTYGEIAEIFGCSRQNVRTTLSQYMPGHFKPYKKDEVMFDGLRDWMNDNRINRSELFRMLRGKECGTVRGSSSSALTKRLRYGKGWNKEDIDILIAKSGMTYEELFCNKKKDWIPFTGE